MIRTFALAVMALVVGDWSLDQHPWLAIPLLIVLAVGLWMIAPGDAVPARAASLRPQPPSAFSQSGIAIAGER